MEISKELASYRKLAKLSPLMIAPAMLYLIFLSNNDLATDSDYYTFYALLVPSLILSVYLLVFKKDLAKASKEYQKYLNANIDPEIRAKNYKRGVLAFPLFGISFYAYGSFTNYVVPTIYFFVLGLSFLWVFFGIIAISIADQAQAKGKSWSAFFWLSLLISPLVTWLIVSSVQPEQGKILEGNKPCPMCAEPVKLAAKMCKHCGSNI
jgi:hypothetical protein